MSTLLLRLAGPLQAWGSSSKFNTRGTNREPTKSGVIGMIASAMGRSRDENIEDLSCLRFGIRVDQEGEFLRDYHVVQNPAAEDPFVTNRHYLSDALFIVGLEGNDDLLKDIECAMKSPEYPLFLGRRACPPTMPIVLGIRNIPMLDALRNEPWMAADWYRKKDSPHINLRIIVDALEWDELPITTRDLPISYSQSHRKHGLRNVVHCSTGPIDNPLSKKIKSRTDHDPIATVRAFNGGE